MNEDLFGPVPDQSTTWNHRVVRVPEGDEHILLLCEVFYDNGKPVGRNDGARVFGDDINEMWSVMGRMCMALCLPILDDFEQRIIDQDEVVRAGEHNGVGKSDMTAEDTNLPELRVGFEAWARDKMRGLLKPDSLMQLESDERTAFYKDAATAWAWAAWRAAVIADRAQRQAVPQGETVSVPRKLAERIVGLLAQECAPCADPACRITDNPEKAITECREQLWATLSASPTPPASTDQQETNRG